MSVFAETLSALVEASPKFPGWGGGPWVRIPISRGLPGERDWAKIVGDGSNSSITEACCLFICRNLPASSVWEEDESA